MNRIGLIAAVVALLSTSACASTINSVFNRPVTAHDFQKNRLMTVTGERRLAFIVPVGSDLRMCAESLPEVSSAVAAASGANVEVTGTGRGAVSDSMRTALLQTFTRTEIAEVLRQMGWQACQAWAQGALDDEEYEYQLARIITAAVEAVRQRATQTLPTTTNLTLNPGDAQAITLALPATATPTPAEPAAPAAPEEEDNEEEETEAGATSPTPTANTPNPARR